MKALPARPTRRCGSFACLQRARAAFALCAAMAMAATASNSLGQTNNVVERFNAFPVIRGQVADAAAHLTNQVRLEITGTVLHEFGPGFFFLHDATGNLRVHCQSTSAVTRGALVEVVGLPRAIETLPWLQFAEVRQVGQGTLPAPRPIRAPNALKEIHDAEYVTLTARVIGTNTYTLRGTTSEVLLLDSEGVLCKALFTQGTHPEKFFPVGTVADFTGVCRLGGRVDEGRQRYVHILVHSPKEVRLVQGPPFWTDNKLRNALAGTIVLVSLATGWTIWQRRKVRLLESSEERFRAMIENSFDVTLVLNADGSLKYMSPAGRRLLGWDQRSDSLMKRGFAEMVHADDLPRIMKAHAEVLEQPGSSHTVSGYRVITADGSLRYAEAIGTNCLHVPGVEGVVVNLRDISERVLANETAKRSEAVTQTINYFATSLLEQDTEDDILWDLAKNCISQLGFADCVIYLVDRDRGLLVQKAALGPKSPEGRVIVNPIIIPLGQGIVGSVAATGKPELIGDTSLDPRYIVDDQRRFSEITVPIVANNEVLGVIDSEHAQKNFFTAEHLKMLGAIASLCANKLVRARAELRLRESHQDLEKRIAERAGELLTANQHLTREIAERARAEKVQRALYAISEAIHSVEDLPSLYQRIHEIIGTLMPAQNFYIALHEPETDMVSFPYHRDEMDPPPAPRKARRGMTEYVLRTGRAALADLEEIARLKQAGEYVQSGAPAKIWLGVPLSSGGRPFGVMAVQDHHNERVYGEEERQILSFVAGQTALAIERKRAENDLRVALAAEKELSQLKSSFVSMVSHEFRTPLEIILSSSNILDRYLERLPPDKRAAQLRAIRKSVHRMNDLIDDVLFLGKFDAGALCCQPVPLDLAAFCRRAANEIESASARQGVIHFASLDSNTDATADEGLLQHILTNILSNAVKYSPLDRAVEFTLNRRGTDAEFVIKDHGCGIPAADQARLFTAFYRGSNVGQTSGSGLGLVIAKRCVDLHGGTIHCQSEQGIGTTFTVTLPLYDGTRVFRRRAKSESETSAATIFQSS